MEPTNTPTPTPTPAPEPVAPVPPMPEPVTPEPVAPVPPMPEPAMSAPESTAQSEPLMMSDFGATDPITMPAPPKTPDPVEEELKTPLRPAAPVPGSIGSAISVPGEVGMGVSVQTPSVAFNDPATQNKIPTNQPTTAKKPISKTTWILLIVLGLVLIGVLVYVLVKFLNP